VKSKLKSRKKTSSSKKFLAPVLPIANSEHNRDLQKLVHTALSWALGAGKITHRYQAKINLLEVSRKEALGVVSEADYASEDFLIKKIKKMFRNDHFLAEESAYKKHGGKVPDYSQYQNAEWCWALDPLDGTTNFLNGMDYYAIVIALLHFGQPVMGVVYRPTTGDCFYATKNGGAYFINFPVSSSDSELKLKLKKAQKMFGYHNGKELRDSLLVTGFAGEKGQKFIREFTFFKRLVQSTRGVRRMGSAALDLCFVAKGIFDGFWETGLAPWDVAAPALICLEAGARVADYRDQEFNPFQSSIIAARKPLYNQLLSKVVH